jgi:MFS family permease
MQRSLESNIHRYYLYSLFSGLLFTLPIWVLFYGRYIGFPEMATMSVVSALITLVLEIPTGALADLIGRRKTVMSGALITATGYFLVIPATHYWQFLGYAVITGVGAALISGADSALLYDSLKELGRENEFSKVIVKSGFFYRLGLIIASFTGGFMYSWWYGLPYLFKGMVFFNEWFLGVYDGRT